uniref:Uncharacterized protein n=1 Tax=Romanomermis culicivorax TaxID=13658 RepID=A0A915LAJ0_ROMCU
MNEDDDENSAKQQQKISSKSHQEQHESNLDLLSSVGVGGEKKSKEKAKNITVANAKTFPSLATKTDQKFFLKISKDYCHSKKSKSVFCNTNVMTCVVSFIDELFCIKETTSSLISSTKCSTAESFMFAPQLDCCFCIPILCLISLSETLEKQQTNKENMKKSDKKEAAKKERKKESDVKKNEMMKGAQE